MPSPFFCLFFFPPPPQFSKDVLVNIYSAYIDNFLNAKDAVRIAKEARPAFIKFLEVGVGATGGAESGLMGLNWLSMAKLGFFQPLLLWGAWSGEPESLRMVSKGVPKTPKCCCCRSKAGVTACVPPNGPVLVPTDFFFLLVFAAKHAGEQGEAGSVRPDDQARAEDPAVRAAGEGRRSGAGTGSVPSWERVRPWLIPPSSLRAAFRAIPSLPALSSSLDTKSTARCAPRPPWLDGGARQEGGTTVTSRRCPHIRTC